MHIYNQTSSSEMNIISKLQMVNHNLGQFCLFHDSIDIAYTNVYIIYLRALTLFKGD